MEAMEETLTGRRMRMRGPAEAAKEGIEEEGTEGMAEKDCDEGTETEEGDDVDDAGIGISPAT